MPPSLETEIDPRPKERVTETYPEIELGSEVEQTKPVPFLDRLQLLPVRRSIPWHIGKELPPEKSSESPRIQQRGACLLSTRGDVAKPPCER